MILRIGKSIDGKLTSTCLGWFRGDGERLLMGAELILGVKVMLCS